jgi:hypothetical protein
MSPRLLLLDLAAVIAFVLGGRSTHGEANTPGAILDTAAPFLAGLLAGWLAARAWRRPQANTTGVIVVLGTLVVGITLRRLVFAGGVSGLFVPVTAGFLAAIMLGWRLVARRISPQLVT